MCAEEKISPKARAREGVIICKKLRTCKVDDRSLQDQDGPHFHNSASVMDDFKRQGSPLRLQSLTRDVSVSA